MTEYNNQKDQKDLRCIYMAINPLTRSSPVRMMGMSSGIDTDSLIQQMMRAHQMRIDNRLRARTLLEWKHQTHTSIKDQINDLRNTYLRSSGLSSVLNRNAYNAVVANLTGANSNAVSIKTGSNSPTGTMTITKVESLAKGASITSDASVTGIGGSGLSMTARLGSLNLTGGAINFTDDKLSLTTEGGDSVEIYRNAGGDYVYNGSQLVFDSNGRATISLIGSGNPVELQKLADGNLSEVTLDASSNEVLGSPSTTEYGTASIDINGETITLNRNMTIEQMLTAVNKSDAEVTMSYDRLADRFRIESNEIGGSALTISGQAFGALGLNQSNMEAGSNAVAYINGDRVERDTNTFDFRGVSVTLNHEFDESVGGAVTVTLKNDASNAISNIKSAVDAFNSILKRIDDLLKDRKGVNERGYVPLTDEEKSMMTDKQIEEWETIAKKGLMKGDAGLQSLANKLRDEIYKGIMSKTDGQYDQNYLSFSNGQIVIHEDRLQAALETDADKVANFFAGISGNTGTGFFYRINDAMTGYVNTSQTRTMKNLEDSIRQVNVQMEKMQKKMYAEEDKLYKQFAAMETALSKLNQQSDWFSSMLGTSNR